MTKIFYLLCLIILFSCDNSAKKENDDWNSITTTKYAQLNTSKETYYAKLLAEFDSEGLLSTISLLGPCFYTSPIDDYENSKRINVGENYKNEIIRMYSNKYGKPQITNRRNQLLDDISKAFFDAISKDHEYDKIFTLLEKAEKQS